MTRGQQVCSPICAGARAARPAASQSGRPW
jgi:hypothetical protein